MNYPAFLKWLTGILAALLVAMAAKAGGMVLEHDRELAAMKVVLPRLEAKIDDLLSRRQ